MQSIAPWLVKALQIAGTEAATTAIQYIMNKYTDHQAEGYAVANAEFVSRIAFLTAALHEYGLSGMAVFYDEGMISAGELFFCAILSWSSRNSALPAQTCGLLEDYARGNYNTLSSGNIMNVTSDTDVMKITNDITSLGQCMNYLMNFGRANNLPALSPASN